MPREFTPTANPEKNTYLLGIAHRLKVDPHRVQCNVRLGTAGGLLLDVRVDGRDLTGPEEKIVAEYLFEAFNGLAPTISG